MKAAKDAAVSKEVKAFTNPMFAICDELRQRKLYGGTQSARDPQGRIAPLRPEVSNRPIALLRRRSLLRRALAGDIQPP
jgi:hypothetical protein